MKRNKRVQNLRDIEQTRIAFVMDKLIAHEYSSLSEQELWAKRLLKHCPKQVWSWPFLIEKQTAIAFYEKATITHIKCTPWGAIKWDPNQEQETEQNSLGPPPF